MTWPFRKLPLALLQLTHQRARLLTALLGVAFANLLMLIQLGLKDSLIDSVALIEQRLDGDLFLVDRRSRALAVSQPFSRRLLEHARGVSGVATAAPLLSGMGSWKNPWTGGTRTILALGLDAQRPALRLPELASHPKVLRGGDLLLFDRTSRPEFGPVPAALDRHQRVYAKVEGTRLRIAGLFTLGASFAADGNLVTGDAAFRRIFPARAAGAVDIGVLRLHRGADAARVQGDLRRYLPASLQVLTREELVAWEQDYWGADSTIGFIFKQGTLIGFIVGVVIVYQILYTDVSNHLAEYATLKAIGYTDRYLLGVVFQEALVLSVLGYVPGVVAAVGVYAVTSRATSIDISLTLSRAALVFSLTLTMCVLSGALAMRKLRQADPAEVF